MFDPNVIDPAVNFLFDLSGKGNALEFAIGTGRIALPLARRGVSVHGIELSRAMASRLTAKTNGDDLSITIGDIAKISTGELYSVVYLVFNTIMNLSPHRRSRSLVFAMPQPTSNRADASLSR